MIPTDPAIRRAMEDRTRALSNFYDLQRRAGSCPIEANELMGDYAKRLDEASQRVADDAFNRDLAILKSVMERSR